MCAALPPCDGDGDDEHVEVETVLYISISDLFLLNSGALMKHLHEGNQGQWEEDKRVGEDENNLKETAMTSSVYDYNKSLQRLTERFTHHFNYQLT